MTELYPLSRFAVQQSVLFNTSSPCIQIGARSLTERFEVQTSIERSEQCSTPGSQLNAIKQTHRANQSAHARVHSGDLARPLHKKMSVICSCYYLCYPGILYCKLYDKFCYGRRRSDCCGDCKTYKTHVAIIMQGLFLK